MLKVDEIPNPGDVVFVDRQPFTAIAAEPYIRKDGTQSTVITWDVPCAECGKPMIVRTGLATAWPHRRCPKHRKPGVKVEFKFTPDELEQIRKEMGL